MDFEEWTHQVNVGEDALAHLAREWLLTNGTGAYAMGTLPGVNTRRYHGLFVPATHPPVGRIVALNQVHEQLVVGGAEDEPLELAVCEFRDDRGQAIHAPRGHQYLRHFERGLAVSWTYSIDSIQIVRELHLHWKEQAATLRYHVTGITAPAVLRLAPMLTLRDFHALLRRGGSEIQAQADGDTLLVQRRGVAVTLRCAGSRFVWTAGHEQWWHNVHYALEAQRGQDDLEDYFVPGHFELDAPADATVALTIALGSQPAAPRGDDRARAVHLAPMLAHVVNTTTAPQPSTTETDRLLVLAADDFVVERRIAGKSLSTIMAGYPWFSDWGRDTFIALPGLLLSTGRFDEARDVLQAFALAIRDGLVPNCFDDYHQEAAHYNTVDASLWYIHAALEYAQASGDRTSWDTWLSQAAMQIIDAYIRGTRFDIRMGGDGLISAGSPNTQLTWMDAACGGQVFTPRPGKAVEINVLWYHALMGVAALLGPEQRRVAEHYKKLAGRVNRSFSKVFWDAELGCLRDHVYSDAEGNEHVDRSIRPNQIFAASLPHSPLPRTKQKQVVATVKRHLLTPFGLRTLPPDHPRYHPHYAGPQVQRDEAYHQGTVWPWLIGPYAEAVLRVGGFSEAARLEASMAISPLLEQMSGGGRFPTLGQLYEIHQAAEPHEPRGCTAQAWSVAEVLRVMMLLRGV